MKTWEAVKAVGWGALFVVACVNTWATFERIQSQRELNGTVKAFKTMLERVSPESKEADQP